MIEMGILIVLGALVAIWYFLIVLDLNPAGYRTVYADEWGSNPKFTRPAGRYRNWLWPYVQKFDLIVQKSFAVNIPTMVTNVLNDPDDNNKTIPINRDPGVDVKSGEQMSLTYKLDVSDGTHEIAPGRTLHIKEEKRLAGYYDFLGGKHKWESVQKDAEKEHLTDEFEKGFKAKPRQKEMRLTKARFDHQLLADEIAKDIMRECWKLNYPMMITSTVSNEILKLTDPDQEAAYKSKTTAKMKKDAATNEQDLEIFIAEKQKRVKELEAEQMGISLNALAKICNIPFDKALYIAKELPVMEEFAKSPGAKVLLGSGHILDNITAAFVKAAKGI